MEKIRYYEEVDTEYKWLYKNKHEGWTGQDASSI